MRTCIWNKELYFKSRLISRSLLATTFTLVCRDFWFSGIINKNMQFKGSSAKRNSSYQKNFKVYVFLYVLLNYIWTLITSLRRKNNSKYMNKILCSVFLSVSCSGGISHIISCNLDCTSITRNIQVNKLYFVVVRH
jgi:hypothetical protein